MKRFGELWSETMDFTMRQVFGEAACELIYSFMERHVSLKREEVGENIEVFHVYLEKLLGLERVRIIQAASLRCLFFKLQREYEEVEAYFLFLDELYEVKFRLLSSALEREGSSCN